MGQQFQNTIKNILSEAEAIREGRQNRKMLFQNCLHQYLAHLNEETADLALANNENNNRLDKISACFENTYERILRGVDLTMIKVKGTHRQKKEFWTEFIKMNAESGTVKQKTQLYLEKRLAEDRHCEAIDRSKDKRLPYKAIVGNRKGSTPALIQHQGINKQFEDKVHAGSSTLHNWQQHEQNKRIQSHSQQVTRKYLNSANHQQILGQFTKGYGGYSDGYTGYNSGGYPGGYHGTNANANANMYPNIQHNQSNSYPYPSTSDFLSNFQIKR